MAAILRRHEVVGHRHVVHEHAPVLDLDRVAFFGNHALDERLVRIGRVVEHHDVAAARRTEPIGELVHDQAVLIGQRRGHALAFDPRHLKSERDDERGVDRRRDSVLNQAKSSSFQTPSRRAAMRAGRGGDDRCFAGWRQLRRDRSGP